MNTFSDLDFVIPSDVMASGDIPKTFIYADQISAEVGVETQLTEHLPPRLRDIGLIRPFSAAFSPEDRQMLLDLFQYLTLPSIFHMDSIWNGWIPPPFHGLHMEWCIKYDKIETLTMESTWNGME